MILEHFQIMDTLPKHNMCGAPKAKEIHAHARKYFNSCRWFLLRDKQSAACIDLPLWTCCCLLRVHIQHDKGHSALLAHVLCSKM